MKLGNESKQAIESLALDKGVAVESMYEALVSAFRSAYMRIPNAAEEARVTLNPDSGEVLIYAQELDNEGNVIEEWKVELDEDEFGRIAMLNSSATQWQHKFSLDISLTEGYIELSGILSGSKSYGEEKIKFGKREKESNNGQMESKTFKYLEDNSWRDEIYEFIDSIINNGKIESGSSSDALETMKLVYSIYFEDEDWRARYNIEKP